MSDINLNLDGLVAFLVAAALGLALLVGAVSCAFYARAQARKKHDYVSAQSIFPHIIGLTISGAGCLIIVLLIFVRDGHGYSHELERWLDHWCWLWALALLSLWPLSVVCMQQWRKAMLR